MAAAIASEHTTTIPSQAVEPAPAPTVAPTPQVLPTTTRSFEDLLRAATIARWGESQWPAMRQLIHHESGLNPYAINISSGACGAFQSLPCAKVLSVAGTLDNWEGQIRWGTDYIANRYGNPTNALAFWRCIGHCGNIYKTATWY